MVPQIPGNSEIFILLVLSYYMLASQSNSLLIDLFPGYHEVLIRKPRHLFEGTSHGQPGTKTPHCTMCLPLTNCVPPYTNCVPPYQLCPPLPTVSPRTNCVPPYQLCPPVPTVSPLTNCVPMFIQKSFNAYSGKILRIKENLSIITGHFPSS